jgi:hypothetical protein
VESRDGISNYQEEFKFKFENNFFLYGFSKSKKVRANGKKNTVEILAYRRKNYLNKAKNKKKMKKRQKVINIIKKKIS